MDTIKEKIVYVLWENDCGYSGKVIGIFSSEEKAEKARMELGKERSLYIDEFKMDEANDIY